MTGNTINISGGSVTGDIVNRDKYETHHHHPPASVAPSPLFNIPPSRDSFVGREAEIARLTAALRAGEGPQVIAGLKGVGGIGKTALAAHVAHQLKAEFPDAGLLVRLRGTSDLPADPGQILADLIGAFHLGAALPPSPEARADIWRGLLAGKRALIILDDARDADQIAPLLPPAPSAAIITSRRREPFLWGRPLALDALPRADSLKLLAPLGLSPKDAEALAEACRDHPLALMVALKTLDNNRDHWPSVADYIGHIARDRSELKISGATGFDLFGALRPSLWLLEQENAALAERWRDLSAFAGDFGAEEAGFLWERPTDRKSGLFRRLASFFWSKPTSINPDAALRSLSDIGLLEPGSAPARWRLHDLMRDLARHGAAAGRFAAVEARHEAFALERLEKADELYLSGGAGVLAGLALYDRIAPEAAAAQARAAERLKATGTDGGACFWLANAGPMALGLRLTSWERVRWWKDALASARAIGHKSGEGVALGNLGNAHAVLGDARKALEYHEQALSVSREIGDRYGEGTTLFNRALALWSLKEPAAARADMAAALTIYEDIGTPDAADARAKLAQWEAGG